MRPHALVAIRFWTLARQNLNKGLRALVRQCAPRDRATGATPDELAGWSPCHRCHDNRGCRPLLVKTQERTRQSCTVCTPLMPTRKPGISCRRPGIKGYLHTQPHLGRVNAEIVIVVHMLFD